MGVNGLPSPYTLVDNCVVDEKKPSEIPRVMGSVVDESTLEGWMSSGTAKGTVFSEGDEVTPRTVASSDLDRVPSSYEGLNWLEFLCVAFPFQLSQDCARG